MHECTVFYNGTSASGKPTAFGAVIPSVRILPSQSEGDTDYFVQNNLC